MIVCILSSNLSNSEKPKVLFTYYVKKNQIICPILIITVLVIGYYKRLQINYNLKLLCQNIFTLPQRKTPSAKNQPIFQLPKNRNLGSKAKASSKEPLKNSQSSHQQRKRAGFQMPKEALKNAYKWCQRRKEWTKKLWVKWNKLTMKFWDPSHGLTQPKHLYMSHAIKLQSNTEGMTSNRMQRWANSNGNLLLAHSA